METTQAKIRNKLTPFWTLTELMSNEKNWSTLNNIEHGKEVIDKLVKQCNSNKNIILDLLKETENE